MNKRFLRTMAVILASMMAIPSGLLAAAATPVPTKEAALSPAPASHVKALQAAVQAGLLDKEAVPGKTMNDMQVTDALAALYPVIVKVDVGSLKPGMEGQDAAVYEALLGVVTEKKGALRARDVSAWTMENRLQKIVAALTDSEKSVKSLKSEKVEDTAKPEDGKAAVQAPEVSAKDLNVVREAIEKTAGELSATVKAQEARLAAVEKGRETDQSKVEGVQDDLSLIRDNLDVIQSNLKNLGEKVEEISRKTEQKGTDLTEQERQWSIMRKDIRDHSEDISAMKQKVERLMAPEKQAPTGFDKAMGSKWLPGAAILVSLTAVVIAASK